MRSSGGGARAERGAAAGGREREVHGLHAFGQRCRRGSAPRRSCWSPPPRTSACRRRTCSRSRRWPCRRWSCSSRWRRRRCRCGERSVMTALPAFSAMSNTGAPNSMMPATSSSVIVKVAVLGVTMVTAPVGLPERSGSRCGPPSTRVSLRIGTVKVLVVTPPAKLSVPAVARVVDAGLGAAVGWCCSPRWPRPRWPRRPAGR